MRCLKVQKTMKSAVKNGGDSTGWRIDNKRFRTFTSVSDQIGGYIKVRITDPMPTAGTPLFKTAPFR